MFLILKTRLWGKRMKFSVAFDRLLLFYVTNFVNFRLKVQILHYQRDTVRNVGCYLGSAYGVSQIGSCFHGNKFAMTTRNTLVPVSCMSSIFKI